MARHWTSCAEFQDPSSRLLGWGSEPLGSYAQDLATVRAMSNRVGRRAQLSQPVRALPEA